MAVDTTHDVLNFWSHVLTPARDNALNLNGSVYSDKVTIKKVVTATLAQINAGAILIPGIINRTITVMGVTQKVTGGFTTATAVVLQDTNASPVNINSTAIANLTTGATLLDNSTGVTNGAGLLGALTLGAGIAVAKTGSSAAGGTSITYCIEYTIN